MLDGKFKIELLDQGREMCVNFGFIEAIEGRTPRRPIMALLNEAMIGEAFHTDIIEAFYLGLRSNNDKRLSLKEIGDAVVTGGIGNYYKLYLNMLTYALTGNTELETEKSFNKKK